MSSQYFDSIRCIVCQNDFPWNFSIKYSKPDCLVVECQRCSFHFIPSHFRKTVNYTAYKSEKVADEIIQSDLWLKIQRNKLRYNLIKKFHTPQKLYDIGCGFGHFLYTGKELGINHVTGVEMNMASVAYIRKYLDLDVEQKDFLKVSETQKFDTFTLWDVLEHIDDADLVIQKISRMISKDGYVFLQVPQIDSFFAKLLKERWWEMGLDHVNYFSKKTIENLFHRNGFQVEKIISSLEIKNVLLYAIVPKLKKKTDWKPEDRQREFNQMTQKSTIIKKLFVFFHNIIYKILSVFKIGDEMIVVAKKL
ncbi:methyltransferase domain-containing protein [candidate division KSB1 bacterium]|nr:methyltransferase domain-containing protein [candidate division KSB1 bacterium]